MAKAVVIKADSSDSSIRISNQQELVSKRIITGHDTEGKGVVQIVDEGYWEHVMTANANYNVLWATKTSPVDIARDETLEEETKAGSLSLPNGTVLRFVDRAPQSKGPMHRTQSLGYGVVLDGEAELLMDSGDRITLKSGDVCIQRATMHQWINKTDKWNKMLFVLLDDLPLEMAGNIHQEDTGLDRIKEIARRA
jgi:quercetin dioxygenase-like cupin family protein